MSDANLVQLTPRGGDVRCAYCHDPLPDAPAGVTCPGCATRLHADCIVEARCLTLGCEHVHPAPPAGFRVAKGSLGAAARRDYTIHHSRWTRAEPTLFGVVLAIACFVLNELGFFRLVLLPSWRGFPSAWWRFAYAPEAQRFFYPLLAWAMAALVATVFRRRGAWVQVGLTGGVVLALGFSLAFVPILPADARVALLVIGFLGLAPLLVLITYVRALRRYLKERPALVSEKDGAEGSTLTPWTVWSVLGGTAFLGAVHQMSVMFERLPRESPSGCFIASAAARGHARVVGAEPVRFADGRVLPVTRQLRALKAAELALLAFTPRLHRAMRVVYDRAGPPLAARLGRTTGTIAWVLLLPMQALAELGLRLLFRDASRLIARTYGSGS